jgi:hydroxyacylglutathione hydrolase
MLTGLILRASIHRLKCLITRKSSQLIFVMINVYTIVVSEFSQNCRILLDQKTREVVVIDPGAEAERIFQLISSLNSQETIEKIDIIITHQHIDHAGGTKNLKEKIEEKFGLNVLVKFHKDCDQYKDTIEAQALHFGMSPGEYRNSPNADVYLKEGDSLKLGENKIKILDTPGHAPGHISLFFDVTHFSEFQNGIEVKYEVPFLIAGDTLFRSSIGRTDLPGGNHQQLLDSIRTKLFTLPENTIVMSGHGPNTNIGFEKETNYFLKENIEE